VQKLCQKLYSNLKDESRDWKCRGGNEKIGKKYFSWKLERRNSAIGYKELRGTRIYKWFDELGDTSYENTGMNFNFMFFDFFSWRWREVN